MIKVLLSLALSNRNSLCRTSAVLKPTARNISELCGVAAGGIVPLGATMITKRHITYNG